MSRPPKALGVAPLLEALPAARRRWKRSDPLLADLSTRHAPQPHIGGRRSAFAALTESIIHQQVSLMAGRSIYRRLRRACGGRLTPSRVLALGEDGLRASGISPQKRGYLLDLARRFASNGSTLRALARMRDDEIIEHLTRIKGIGEWTAQMFLLFHLGRPDILAPGDLGLQLAVQKAYGVRPGRVVAFMEARQADWSPHASLASLVLWQYRNDTRHANGASRTK